MTAKDNIGKAQRNKGICRGWMIRPKGGSLKIPVDDNPQVFGHKGDAEFTRHPGDVVVRVEIREIA